MRTIFSLTGLCLLGGLFLTSCQTMSKQECVAADWQSVGEADGAAGYGPQQRFADRAKDCAKAGIVADQSTWQKGYDDGLKKYCTPMSGLNAGQSGQSYANVCPPDTSEGFLRGYRLGRADYEKVSDIRDAESRINRAEAQIDFINKLAADEKISRGEADNQIGDQRREIRQAHMVREDLMFERERIQSDINWFMENPNANDGRLSRYGSH